MGVVQQFNLLLQKSIFQFMYCENTQICCKSQIICIGFSVNIFKFHHTINSTLSAASQSDPRRAQDLTAFAEPVSVKKSIDVTHNAAPKNRAATVNKKKRFFS